MNKICMTIVLLIVVAKAYAQPGGGGQYNFNSGDPALAYNKYSILQGETQKVQIGAFKVIGSPYLLGIKHLGSVNGKEGIARTISAGYDTYRQEVEIYPNNNAPSFKKTFHEIDSFDLVIQPNNDTLHFVNLSDKGFGDKAFLQVVKVGNKYDLLKCFKSNLGLTTNYVQADLRQFDLEITYYCYNKQNQKFSKLKLSGNAIKKQFPQLKDVVKAEDDEKLRNNPDPLLILLFTYLNN